MALGYVTKESDYWIQRSAISITLNALGNANRTQGSVASGAVVMCFVDGNETLGYNAAHGYKTWPISLSPTYFNTDTEKYVYVAIPRSSDVGSQAVIVFPSEQLDIDGKNADGQQIGSTDYLYIYIQGHISAVENNNGQQQRRWLSDPAEHTGKLDTAQGNKEAMQSNEWYEYSAVTQLTTFLKNLTMQDGTKFLKLFAEQTQIKIIEGLQRLVFGSGEGAQPLTGVATAANAATIPDESTQHVVTPSYLDEFGNTRYLSKVHDDTAAGVITFLKGLLVGTGDYGIGEDGAAKLLSLVFDQVIKSKDAKKGFSDGHGIYLDALEGLIETDGMNVRGFMRVMELIVNRLQLMESDYSFTEGDTVERIDYEDNGQTLVLTMHKDHDNDYTPFYEGDILYGKVNDLLPRDGSVPDGHTVTKNGSYYTTWMRVKSVDLATNQVRVALYQGQLPDGTPIVPGATNFSPDGTAITTDVTAPMLAEYNAHGGEGYDTMLTLTRHGNVADSPDAAVKQSQLGRQQSWVLSTTDKRLSFFWNVDAPIIRDENYALCLGILPDLANLPTTRNPDMPSLYVNTVFYDHQHRANWPAKVVKEDRGQWSQAPVSTYSGFDGEYTPDGTLPATSPYAVNVAVQTGDTISDPYHCRTISMDTWLRYRLNSIYSSYTDANLMAKMLGEWREEVDLEVSRVWKAGKLWECLVDCTTEEPGLGCTDWQLISGDTVFKADFMEAYQLYDPEDFQAALTVYCMWGSEDVTDKLLPQDIVWTRYTEDRNGNERTASDTIWNTAHAYGAWPTDRLRLELTQADLDAETEFPSLVRFRCEVTIRDGNGAELYNDYVEIEHSN